LLIVQKYGGTSVANAERINNVAGRIAGEYRKGNRMVVILSAQGDTTDDLIAKAMEISDNPSKREMDMLLSTGEQQSIALAAMAVIRLGLPAISLNAMQIGLRSSSAYGNARIRKVDTDRINAELERGNIVFIAGFQAVNRLGDITTLGRGGSDTTAVAIAAALAADICEIYTDVDGVYTADPRVIKTARKIDEISYDEMLELASLGAKVLHNRSVELAKKFNVRLVVRSSLNYNAGTLVKEDVKVEKTYITGIGVDKDVARVALIGVKDKPGVAFKLFSMLAKAHINIDLILQSIGRDNTKDITFTVAKANLAETLELIKSGKNSVEYGRLDYDDKVAKLSVVGAGIAANSGVAALMFEALFDSNVNINMISTSEIKISVLINESDADRAAIAVHDKLIDSQDGGMAFGE